MFIQNDQFSINVGDWDGDIYLNFSFLTMCAPASDNNCFVRLCDENGSLKREWHFKYPNDLVKGWEHKGPYDITGDVNGLDKIILQLGLEDNEGVHDVAFDNICIYTADYFWGDVEYRCRYDPFDYDSLGPYDTIAEEYVWADDWVAIDPYAHQLRSGGNSPELSIIEEDADWALAIHSPSNELIIFGESFDPLENLTAPFFETDDDYIIPNETTLWKYYDVAKEKGATALIWFWYPDSYASSADDLPSYVTNVWAVEQEIWEDIAKGG